MLPSVIDPNFRELDYFPPPDISRIVRLRPISAIGTKVDFSTGKSDYFIDLSDVKLAIKFKICKKNGDAVDKLAEDKYLGTINNIAGSFFQQLKISLNSTIVTQTNLQPYFAYFSQWLSNTSDARKSHLASAGFEEFSAKLEGVHTSGGFKKLAERVVDSQECYVISQVQTPLLLQKSKFLPPQVDMTLEFTQSSNEFFLNTNITESLNVQLLSADLYVRYVKLSDNLVNSFQAALTKSAYLIPYVRTEIFSTTIPSTLNEFSINHLHYGSKLPSKAYFTFVLSDNFTGSKTTSPFSLTHANLKSYSFVINGMSVPLSEISFSMSDGNCVQLYDYVNSQFGFTGNGPSPLYTIEKFKSDHFIICQCLQRDVSNFNFPGQTGTLGLNLKFSTPLAANTVLLVMLEYSDSIISINKDGLVKLE